MNDAYAHCERLVREADKDRFLAALFAPAAARRGMLALYAFSLEVASIRSRAHQPMPGEIRLQWWRDAIAGDGHGDVTAHPVAGALIDTIERHALARERLIDLIDARTFDLYDEPMASLGALEIYAAQTSSVLVVLAAQILAGPPGIETTAFATHAGIAISHVAQMRAFPIHAARGQLYLPGDIMAAHGAAAADVFAGRTTAPLHAALAAWRAEAWRQFKAVDAVLGSLPPAVRPAFLPLAVVPLYLKRMEAADYDPFATIVDVAQWRRQWALWRAARRGRRSA